MMTLTHEQASLIVTKLMGDIPYNINIMDHQGKIIGSGDSRRIGHIHSGAKRTIKEKRKIEVFQDSTLEKKGIHEPIVYHNEIIGVVGITGDPDEVRPFTKLVRTIVLLFIEELDIYKEQEKRRLDKENFMRKLKEQPVPYEEEFRNEAFLHYHLKLGASYVGILTGSLTTMSQLVPKEQIFEENHYYLGFLREEIFNLEKVNELKGEDLIIVTTPNSHLAKLISELKNNYLAILFLNKQANQVYCTSECFIGHWFDFPIEVKEELLLPLKQEKELMTTLIQFVKNNGNMKQTAADLHVHRNSISYRLNKLHELTQKNPNDWADLWELMYHCAYLYKKEH
ncbi:CdaR family transcriptional regulator [Vagococcus humatus]|uniref:Carbohydrate diacid regulator n=1 Tax=Vagococcus humatus TaxID=1889241 RepID=A0A3R9YG00_9ENTE|nr:sugar diacid recognition domain-containing protein [Vagococcus humatus]RST90252.1 carbohydrate diacid regulator [Vagococcus humatus]